MRSCSKIFAATLLVVLSASCQGGPTPMPTGSPVAGMEARCSALHWFDVRQALEAVDHYTYRSADHVVFDILVPPGSPRVVALDRTLLGAYQAPDRMREVSEWAAGADPFIPFWEIPDVIVIGTRSWRRVPIYDKGLWHVLPSGAPGSATPPARDVRGGGIRDTIVGLAAIAPWSIGGIDPATPNECVFTNRSAPAADGHRFEASLWVDPTTVLPTRLVLDKVAGGTGSVSHFDTTIEAGAEVAIEPPGSDELAPASPQS